MTILPRVHGVDALTFEKQNESSLDITNPVVVSADFVLEVSHAYPYYAGNLCKTILQSVDDLVQINEDGVAAAAQYVRAFFYFFAGL